MSEWPGNGTQMPKPGTDPNDPNKQPSQPAANQTAVEIAHVSGYTANLLPQREGLVNWIQTVSLEGVERFEIHVVKKADLDDNS